MTLKTHWAQTSLSRFTLKPVFSSCCERLWFALPSHTPPRSVAQARHLQILQKKELTVLMGEKYFKEHR